MNSEKKYSWHKISSGIAELQLPDSGLKEIEIAGKKICISLHKDQLHACAHKCPHAGGILANGYIDAVGNIVCPIHRYKFNMQNGRNTSGEGYYLKNFPIEFREDGIYIAF